MNTALARFSFGLLVLLACAIAAWHSAEPPPTREVVELVSVMYKPARVISAAPVEAVKLESTAAAPVPVPAAGIHRVSAPKRVARARPAPGAKALPRQQPRAPVARQEQEAQAPLPAVFVPIRSLGFFLQARLGLAREEPQEQPAQRKR